jgi:tRNA U34 5-methylaminomethyl-2-thiouridine-forming methyltransferase MnmC
LFSSLASVQFRANLNTQTNPDKADNYRIVRLATGAYSVHSLAHAETFHPVIGPVAEAQALYVSQLRRLHRQQNHADPFVIWDVGLGAAANALTVIHAARDVPCSIRLLSFDHTLAPLEFALAHPQHLEYLAGYQAQLSTLLSQREACFREGSCSIHWNIHLADFPSLLADPAAQLLAKPQLVMFDAFSPAKNPGMWTLGLFTKVFELLDHRCPCVLPTYSRSTLLRVTLLLAGFFVGVGHATGEKEETTIAANTLDLIEEPLDQRWLQRVQRSSSAQPLLEPIYRQAPLSSECWQRLQSHPQFKAA